MEVEFVEQIFENFFFLVSVVDLFLRMVVWVGFCFKKDLFGERIREQFRLVILFVFIKKRWGEDGVGVREIWKRIFLDFFLYGRWKDFWVWKLEVMEVGEWGRYCCWFFGGFQQLGLECKLWVGVVGGIGSGKGVLERSKVSIQNDFEFVEGAGYFGGQVWGLSGLEFLIEGKYQF